MCFPFSLMSFCHFLTGMSDCFCPVNFLRAKSGQLCAVHARGKAVCVRDDLVREMGALVGPM